MAPLTFICELGILVGLQQKVGISIVRLSDSKKSEFLISLSYFQVDRHQCTYSDQVSFPCAGPDAKASFYKPTSVHRLNNILNLSRRIHFFNIRPNLSLSKPNFRSFRQLRKSPVNVAPVLKFALQNISHFNRNPTLQQELCTLVFGSK